MEQMGAFLPLILIFGVFYILLIRPQQKKVKLHREMINNLRRGDKIITSGGIIGSIIKVNDNKELIVEISENVEIKIAPGMVSDLYVSPDTEKQKASTQKENAKNKTSIFSNLLGKKTKIINEKLSFVEIDSCYFGNLYRNNFCNSFYYIF
tara:strand:+ start:247 stop:699 length:453 start_codon:yes stop_codon:yes gene_type:complete